MKDVHWNLRPEKKEKHPLEYGFVRFFKKGSKYTFSVSKDFPKPDEKLCFSVYNPWHSDPIWDKKSMKRMAEELSSKADYFSEEEFEIRGRQAKKWIYTQEAIHMILKHGGEFVDQLIEKKCDRETKEILSERVYELIGNDIVCLGEKAYPEEIEAKRMKLMSA